MEKRRCTLDTHYDVIILGSGPAGLTAGIYTGRARLRTLILGERPGGKPLMYEHIGNYPGFPDGVTGAQLMMGMLKQVGDLGVDRVPVNATGISVEEEGNLVITEGDRYTAAALIVATGSDPIRLSLPGTEELEGRGIFYCAHCDAPVFKAMDKTRATVVGGGDSALYTAMYLTRYAEDVTIVHRGERLRANKEIQDAVLSHPKIQVRLHEEIVGVIAEADHITGIVLKDRRTGGQTECRTDGLFVGIGQEPNSALLRGLVDLDSEGFILVNTRMETSKRGVFAAGDVIQKPLRQIVTAAGDGAVAADSAVRFIEGRRD